MSSCVCIASKTVQNRNILHHKTVKTAFVFPDELFWLLSQQPQVVFTCQPCCQVRCIDSSLKEELQSKLITGLEEVLVGLLASETSQHLLACKEVRTLHVSV